MFVPIPFSSLVLSNIAHKSNHLIGEANSWTDQRTILSSMPYDSSSYLDPALTMNPVSQSSSSPGGKSLNAASSHNPVQQQQGQTTSPGFESNTRRSGSYSSGIPAAAAARNNQMQRKQHKSSKKPKLAVEDNMEESVSSIPTRSRRLSVLMFLDGREKRK